jgi:8-amino-3,8-dideoxy-alpha-D-manno-octulosonate transaminase
LPPPFPGNNWIDAEEEAEIGRALKSGNAFSGTLASDLQAYYGCNWVVPTASGTAALFSAAAVLDVRPGTEVLIPGFAWIPTFASVISRGAIPVLVEVGEDLGMDPEDLQKKITPRSRLILPVHMCGAAADIDPIMEIARSHGLQVLEDCAQAATCRYKGKFVGTFGDIGAFSLQQNKHFSSFTGGYMISDRPDLFRVSQQVTDCGLTRVMDVVSHEVNDVVEWGMGHKLNVLAQAMARVQLTKAQRIVAAMSRAHRRIKEGISDIPGIRFRPLADPSSDAGSFLITYWPTAEIASRVATELVAEGGPAWTFHLADYGTHMYYHMLNLVQKAPWIRGTDWPWGLPENQASVYSYEKGALPRSDEIFSRGVVMAVPSRLSDEHCDLIASAYRKIAANVMRD